MTGRADLLRERNGGGAAAATDIDDPLAGLGPGAIDQNFGDRREQDVLRLLPVGPALAGRSVPVRNLVGVLIVACRGVPCAETFVIGPPALLRNFGATAFALRSSACPAEARSGEGW